MVETRQYRDTSYNITNDGRVYSTRNDIYLKPSSYRGYDRINICEESKVSVSVHRMVASTFIPNPENKPCVNHKNGIKTDNNVTNLEWCTYAENNKHALDTGLNKLPEGEKHWNSKLNESNVIEIKRLLKESNLTHQQISEMFSVSRGTISCIFDGATWKHIPND